ncbi:MAG: hypothetical protein EBU46_10740 [Nitrosomonadaceae bacterium]|nr:hypothetical protein [Nitrosomonadaceae bacterium]
MSSGLAITTKIYGESYYSTTLYFGFVENRYVYNAKAQLPRTGNILYVKSGSHEFVRGAPPAADN